VIIEMTIVDDGRLQLTALKASFVVCALQLARAKLVERARSTRSIHSRSVADRSYAPCTGPLAG
jgi:hypothetical protein